jgi:type III restriction enzyme
MIVARIRLRNVKPTSFSLQTATERSYPDFICKLEDGRILVVEYKNSKDYDLPDNEEKRRLSKFFSLLNKMRVLSI